MRADTYLWDNIIDILKKTDFRKTWYLWPRLGVMLQRAEMWFLNQEEESKSCRATKHLTKNVRLRLMFIPCCWIDVEHNIRYLWKCWLPTVPVLVQLKKLCNFIGCFTLQLISALKNCTIILESALKLGWSVARTAESLRVFVLLEIRRVLFFPQGFITLINEKRMMIKR